MPNLSIAAGSFDLYINGNSVTTLNLPATGSTTTFAPTTLYNIAIPAGAELQVIYQQGKNGPANLDCMDVLP